MNDSNFYVEVVRSFHVQKLRRKAGLLCIQVKVGFEGSVKIYAQIYLQTLL